MLAQIGVLAGLIAACCAGHAGSAFGHGNTLINPGSSSSKAPAVQAQRAAACKMKTISQDFTKSSSLSSAFSLELGKKADNIVIRSKQAFSLPYSFTINSKMSGAPGIVSTAIFRGGDGSDEVDLETVGADPTSLQTVLWRRGKRFWFNTNPAPSNFDASKAFHTYTLSVTATNFTMAVDGKVIRTKSKGAAAKPWVSQTLPFAMGPWMSTSGADWAGVVSWKKNPAPSQVVKSVSITGCVA